MDEDGRGGRPPVTTPAGDGAPARRRAVATGRLDDRWDPAWDTAWWDPAWNAHRPADAAQRTAAAAKRREAASAADSAEPGIPASLPDVPAGDATRPAAAVPAGPVAVPRRPLQAPADPWGQVLATTIGLWVTRRLPSAGITALMRGGGRQPGPQVRGGARVPVRLLAVSVLGAGLLTVGAGTAGLLVASGSPTAPARWAARPSPVPVPSGRTAAPTWLATVQRTARPVWLTVPAIGVRTRLVDLGLNRNGTLQVPENTEVAGWFTGSPRPGAIGSAVIAGHVDSRTGPAVFFWLRTMRPGERIYVGRADGTLAVFTVTSVRMYPKDEFPTAAVYGPVPDAELRLITCGGIFDESLGSYLSNVVVDARLTG